MPRREQGRPLSAARRAGLWVGGAGLAWAGLCLALWRDGQQPSGPTGPVDPGDWYLLQALALPWLLPILWGIQAAVTAWLVSSPRAAWVAPLGRAYAGAVGLALVAPECLAYAVGGAPGLRAAAPVAGATVVLVAWLGAASVLRRRCGLGWAAAAGRSLPGLLVQALVGAPFLR